ncbi:hypothetical protein ACS0PU_010130 [Formica fusca]
MKLLQPIYEPLDDTRGIVKRVEGHRPSGVITKPVLGVIADKGYLNRRNEVQYQFAARELVCLRDFYIKGKVSRRHGHFPPLFARFSLTCAMSRRMRSVVYL